MSRHPTARGTAVIILFATLASGLSAGEALATAGAPPAITLPPAPAKAKAPSAAGLMRDELTEAARQWRYLDILRKTGASTDDLAEVVESVSEHVALAHAHWQHLTEGMSVRERAAARERVLEDLSLPPALDQMVETLIFSLSRPF